MNVPWLRVLAPLVNDFAVRKSLGGIVLPRVSLPGQLPAGHAAGFSGLPAKGSQPHRLGSGGRVSGLSKDERGSPSGLVKPVPAP